VPANTGLDLHRPALTPVNFLLIPGPLMMEVRPDGLTMMISTPGYITGICFTASAHACRILVTSVQGITLVYFSAQPEL